MDFNVLTTSEEYEKKIESANIKLKEKIRQLKECLSTSLH
jgi:hypothetical protein